MALIVLNAFYHYRYNLPSFASSLSSSLLMTIQASTFHRNYNHSQSIAQELFPSGHHLLLALYTFNETLNFPSEIS